MILIGKNYIKILVSNKKKGFDWENSETNNNFLGMDRLGQLLISRLYLGIERGRNNGRNNAEREYLEVN